MAFTWIPFYKEFAQKLLQFRNNRPPLVNWIYDNLQGYINHFKDGPDGRRVPDTDPFTVFAIINRGITFKKKQDICTKFKGFLNISAPVPEDFISVPEMNNRQSNFMAFEDRREEGDIERLWNVFEDAVLDKEIKDAYDALNGQFLIKYNITMGLFWIRPDKYLALDGNNRTNLELIGVASFKGSGFVPYDEYKDIMKSLDAKMESGELECTNYPEFSQLAYIQNDGASTRDLQKKESTKLNSLIDGTIEEISESEESYSSSNVNYWWLTGKPKYWSPTMDWEVGEDIDYTLYTENGNKRRIFKHFFEAKPGDVVIAYEATPVLQIVAIGKVMAETDGEVLYIRKVEELLSPIPYSEILTNSILNESEPIQNRCQGSLFRLTKEEYEEIMRLIRINNPKPIVDEKEITEYQPYFNKDFLKEVYMDEQQLQTLKSMLLRKQNLILQGAPGVGKTYAAKRLAYAITGIKDEDRIIQVQFHQNYSYEDFVMGYKPNENGGFELKNGKFYDFCKKAENDRSNDYFVIIDEINRGNLSKIFGELLMLIENDYRDIPIQLAYKDENFAVPSNLYIIGMMNTADRSLAMIDYALRRRFSFFEMKPAFDNLVFRNEIEKLSDPCLNNLIEAIIKLNKVIENDDSLGSGFCIGHSYLCNLGDNYDLGNIVEYDIIPMLREYWFDNDETFNREAQNLRKSLNDRR